MWPSPASLETTAPVESLTTTLEGRWRRSSTPVTVLLVVGSAGVPAQLKVLVRERGIAGPVTVQFTIVATIDPLTPPA